MIISVDKLLHTAEQYVESSDLIGVCNHIEDVVVGDIYIAAGKGLSFIEEALNKDASLVIYDACDNAVNIIDNDQIIGINNFDNVVKFLVRRVYGNIVDSISLIGITGTNGKTSTASFVCELLNALGQKTGYIGTLGFGIVGQSIIKGRNTTPDMVTLYRYITILSIKGCRSIAIEVSSHAIALSRIHGLSFFVGVFLNLSHEHIDFHGSMKNYEKIKCSFFTDYKINFLIVNLDDKIGRRIAKKWKNDKSIIGFSLKDLTSNYIKYNSYSIHADGKYNINMQYKGHIYKFSMPLYGEFNMANIVAAIASCIAFNYSISDLMRVVVNISPVPGRMEYLKTDHHVNVFIDYAHTPASVKTVLEDQSFMSENTWCILGSGGNRDIGKRAEMASIATSHVSHLVICDDNVRHDSATKIVIDMLYGIKFKSGTIICRDREKAIAYVLSNSYKNDRVFLLGKGNESNINYGNYKISHCDLDIVEKYGRDK